MKSVTLKSPIKHNGKVIKTVTLREPSVADLAKAERFDEEAKKITEADPSKGYNVVASVLMIELVSDMPRDAIWHMGSRDFIAVQKEMEPFLPGLMGGV